MPLHNASPGILNFFAPVKDKNAASLPEVISKLYNNFAVIASDEYPVELWPEVCHCGTIL